MKKEIMAQKIWDRYWKNKDSFNVEKIIRNDSYYRLLKRLVDISQNKNLNILEVGCGSGIRTLTLLREFQNSSLNITLLDFSPVALSLAKKNAEENGIVANFVLASALNLPFPDESFDIVWNEGVNEHFDDEKRQLIFYEMARVCKQKGQIIVIVPNALNLPYRITKKILEIKNQWIYGFEKPYTIFELKKRIRNAGVTPVNSGGIQIIVSLFTFLELFSKKVSLSKKESTLKFNRSGIKKLLKRIDEYLEVIFGALFGRDIGIKGIKNNKLK